MIGILFEKRIVDDSGFPRTPDRPVELLGTRERYPRSVKTMIGARGPNSSAGSTIDHRWHSLRQCLEHRVATSLLPLIYAHFLLSVLLSNSLIFSDTQPQQWQGSGLTQGLIRVYLSCRHSLCLTLSHVNT